MAKIEGYLDENSEYKDKSLAEIIKDRRESLNISQREMARKLRIDNSGLAKIEKGIRKKPSSLILKKLSMFLQIDLAFLMTKAGYDQDEIDVVTNQTMMYVVGSNLFLDDLVIAEHNKLDILTTTRDLYKKIISKDIKLIDKNGFEVKEYNKLIREQLKDLDNQIDSQKKTVAMYDEQLNYNVKK